MTPIFARATAWRALDVMIGIIMWSIAVRLVADIWPAAG
jgi:arginine exporter protein ArgO